MYTVWHVDKYKITFKLVIDHWSQGPVPARGPAVEKHWARWSTFDSRQGQERSFFRHRVQTGCGAELPSCPVDAGGSFPRGRAARGSNLTTLPSYSAKSKNAWNYTPPVPHVFMT
jgi:hypothetical protein